MLRLFFPQWQGSGHLALYEGACQLREALRPLAFTNVPVSRTYSLTTCENILGYSQIATQLSQACQILAFHNPNKLFTLGGDCGIEIAPVSFLNQKYGSDLAVIWLDAHGDLNTPDSSPSAHFHGMPLRTLLGEGDPALLKQAFSVLSPEQIFLVGTRELDPPEGRFIRKKSISVLSSQAVNAEQGKSLIQQIKSAGFTRLYIHLDLDVIDPQDFSRVVCLTPNGIRLESLQKFLRNLRDSFDAVGSSILEFLPNRFAINEPEAIRIVNGIYSESLNLE